MAEFCLKKTRLDFIIALPVATLAMAVLFGVLAEFAGLELGSSSSALPFIAAVYYAGSRAGKHASAVPPGAMLWRVARELTLIGLAISLLLAVPLLMIEPEIAATARAGFQAAPVLVWLAIVLVLVAIHIVGARYIFSTAMKAVLRAK